MLPEEGQEENKTLFKRLLLACFIDGVTGRVLTLMNEKTTDGGWRGVNHSLVWGYGRTGIAAFAYTGGIDQW